MSHLRRIYRLSPSQFSAETIAVTFAKTSRSPEPFDVIASELNEEASSKFSEKWIVGYGHSSVAEHAVLHLALENVSRLAIETIEGNRLASYTEKSTRYQEWDPKAYVVPPELEGSEFLGEYLEVIDDLFATYARSLEALKSWSEANTPRLQNENEKAWANRARVIAVDVARFILPAASVANVGVTMNARALEYAIKKMLSSELEEVRQIGAEVKAVATEELPTLVKYANPIAYLDTLRKDVRSHSNSIDTISKTEWCQLKDADSAGEDRVLAAVLYRFGDDSYQVCLDQVLNMPASDKQALVDSLFAGMSDYDVPLRELEFTEYDFDILMDQGAYFEFKRHRMMTQTVQTLSTNHGYALPKAITEAGFEAEFRRVMARAHALNQKLAAWNREVAAYVVPNAFNRRVLCCTNLREIFHFIKLRCANNAHFSIRRVGRGMLEAIQPLHPLFSAKLNLKNDETMQSLSDEYFTGLAELADGRQQVQPDKSS